MTTGEHLGLTHQDTSLFYQKVFIRSSTEIFLTFS